MAFGAAWLFLILSSRISGLGVIFVAKRSLIALPFALAAVTAIFSLPGQTLTEWDFGPWHLVATDAGLLRFLSIMVRSWLSVQGAILLIATTRFPDLIHAFEHLRVPHMLVTVIAFLYRYMFVLTDEVIRLMRARQSRSASMGGHKTGGSIAWRARVAGNMIGQLFLRSYERSDRIYNAMLARGYTGHIRTLNHHEMLAIDWLFSALAAVSILVLQLIAYFSVR